MLSKVLIHYTIDAIESESRFFCTKRYRLCSVTTAHGEMKGKVRLDDARVAREEHTMVNRSQYFCHP